jgi:glycosyltransferase involved in cell wall biosynthesis
MKKIAFIKVRSFSFINPSLIEQVQRTFPEYTVDVIDLKDWLIQNKLVLGLAFLNVFKEYWREILQGKKKANECLFTTRYIFKKIQKLLPERIRPAEYAFTFQTQTLFDASVDGIPHFIYTDHTVLANLHYPDIDPQRALFSKAWMQLEPAIYAKASKVFTASNFARDSAISDYHCLPDQVVCVYTGINVAIASPEHKDYSAQNILFVGVEWERKGGPEVIAAFKQVLAVCPNAQLTIVGCTPSIDVPNCTIVGRIPKEQVAEYYREATIFCMPSRIEPAGIAFTEAAMYKLPIISALSGGIPDRVIHGETGYLVPVGDVAMLAQYLIELLTNPERCQTFGAAGYQLAKDYFTWERVGDVMHDYITPYLNHATVASTPMALRS